jgi:hypothetical protein
VNSNCGNGAAGAETFFSVAEEEVGAAGGAEVAEEDVDVAEAGPEKL